MNNKLYVPHNSTVMNEKEMLQVNGGACTTSVKNLNPFKDCYFMAGFKTGVKIGIKAIFKK
ncbi:MULTISPECIES: hypothetical protein [Priestia]|uniref:hypothetical protein n=1 Tax=Priestia TaxID=2800373 RepID=UPI00232FC1FD|nr:hypothetical protein [Priestia sp. AB]MDC0706645.1 hypothetical protein [Priestia sp. AB]